MFLDFHETINKTLQPMLTEHEGLNTFFNSTWQFPWNGKGTDGNLPKLRESRQTSQEPKLKIKA